MKKLIITAVLLVFALSANINANTDYSKRVGGYFYTSLSPYGTWLEIGFGTPVWRPTNLKRSWTPYNYGQWVYTDYGWYWDSYEPFGEIVYHYGRWYYDDYYGWIWVPDYEWAPAWVEWRYDDDYIGWAPLSPYASFSISVGIHYSYDYHVSYHYWNFVRYNHFCDRKIYNYYVTPQNRYKVYQRTKVRTNYSYYDGRVRNNGVEFDKIRERVGRTIEKRNIVTVNDPNELTRDRNTKSRDKEVRTYIASREDISNDGLRDVKVERNEKKSTLDFNKVELGNNRNLNKTTERNNSSNVSTRETNKTTTTNRNQVKKQETNKNVQRSQTTNTSKSRNTEVKRNDSTVRSNSSRDNTKSTDKTNKTRTR